MNTDIKGWLNFGAQQNSDFQDEEIGTATGFVNI